MESQLLTPEQVASRLQITLNTIYTWLRAGRLPGVQIGRRWRVRPEDLDAFVAAGGQPPSEGLPDEGPTQDHPSIWDLAMQARSRIPPEDLARIPSDVIENLDHYLYGRPKAGNP